MVKRAIRTIVRFVMKYYLVVLLLAVTLGVVSYPRTKAFFANINTDLTELIPQHYKSVESINEIRDKFKAIKSLIILVEDQNPDTAKKFIGELDTYLEEDPEVDRVESTKRGYEFFDKHKLIFIELDDLKEIRDRIDRRIQKEKLGGLYIDFETEDENEEFKFGDIEKKYRDKYSAGATSEYYTNDDETIYSVYVYPKKEPEGIKDSDKFYKYIKEKVAQFSTEHKPPSTKLYFTGTVRTRVDEYNTIIHDLKKAGLISGLGIALVLILYFRRIFAVGLLFMPLTLSIFATFAFSSLFIKHLNLVTSFLFAILGGLGVEIGIHMLSRYIEERRPRTDLVQKSGGKNMEEALFTVLYHTGGSALTSAATVSATFLVLIINDFKGFSEFGFIAGFGLIINYLCYIFVFPSLLVFAEKIRLLSFKRSIGFEFKTKREEAGVRKERFPLPRFVLAGLGIFVLITLFDLPHVDFEWRFSKIKANIPAAQEAKAKQRLTSSTVNSPAMVVIHNKEEANAIKKALDEKMENQDSVVNNFKSYYDLKPYNQEDKLVVVGEMQDLLADKTLKLVKGEHKKDLDKFKEALAETTLIEEEEIPPRVKELFWGQKGESDTQIAYINPLPDLELDDGRNAIKFAEEVQEIETPAGAFYPSSDAIVFADVLRTMISDGKRVVVIAFAVVFIIVFLDFRKFSVAALIVSPILLGVFVMFGFMYILKLKLNFYNMVVLPIVVGTSIDNAVHLYHRYKEMGKGSLISALRSTGGAALMSSMTNICGFLGLVFASHNGLRSIGSLAVTGMVACLITTLVYFPALLQVLEDRRK